MFFYLKKCCRESNLLALPSIRHRGSLEVGGHGQRLTASPPAVAADAGAARAAAPRGAAVARSVDLSACSSSPCWTVSSIDDAGVLDGRGPISVQVRHFKKKMHAPEPEPYTHFVGPAPPRPTCPSGPHVGAGTVNLPSPVPRGNPIEAQMVPR